MSKRLRFVQFQENCSYCRSAAMHSPIWICAKIGLCSSSLPEELFPNHGEDLGRILTEANEIDHETTAIKTTHDDHSTDDDKYVVTDDSIETSDQDNIQAREQNNRITTTEIPPMKIRVLLFSLHENGHFQINHSGRKTNKKHRIKHID